MENTQIEKLVHEIGQNWVALRNECYTECANLFDTHEVTLAEKNCVRNCFRKISFAHEHFSKIAYERLNEVNSLKKENFNAQYLNY
jgi:hypothetical protein